MTERSGSSNQPSAFDALASPSASSDDEDEIQYLNQKRPHSSSSTSSIELIQELQGTNGEDSLMSNLAADRPSSSDEEEYSDDDDDDDDSDSDVLFDGEKIDDDMEGVVLPGGSSAGDDTITTYQVLLDEAIDELPDELAEDEGTPSLTTATVTAETYKKEEKMAKARKSKSPRKSPKSLPSKDSVKSASPRKRRKKKTFEEADQPEKKRKLNFERRNIRKIMEGGQLDEETIRAQQEELHRMQRLQEKRERMKSNQLQTLLDEDFDDLDDNVRPFASMITGRPSDGVIRFIKPEPEVVEISSDEDAPPAGPLTKSFTSSTKSDDDDALSDIVDPNNCGNHVNDSVNRPDAQGRVLVNVGHPADEPDIFLAPQLAVSVKPHQIGGIRFLYDNLIESLDHYKNSGGFGCILAHSMGLGKTLQVISFTDIFLRHSSGKRILIIVPVNTLYNWISEFNMWLPTAQAIEARIAARTKRKQERRRKGTSSIKTEDKLETKSTDVDRQLNDEKQTQGIKTELNAATVVETQDDSVDRPPNQLSDRVERPLYQPNQLSGIVGGAASVKHEVPMETDEEKSSFDEDKKQRKIRLEHEALCKKFITNFGSETGGQLASIINKALEQRLADLSTGGSAKPGGCSRASSGSNTPIEQEGMGGKTAGKSTKQSSKKRGQRSRCADGSGDGSSQGSRGPVSADGSGDSSSQGPVSAQCNIGNALGALDLTNQLPAYSHISTALHPQQLSQDYSCNGAMTVVTPVSLSGTTLDSQYHLQSQSDDLTGIRQQSGIDSVLPTLGDVNKPAFFQSVPPNTGYPGSSHEGTVPPPSTASSLTDGLSFSTSSPSTLPQHSSPPFLIEHKPESQFNLDLHAVGEDANLDDLLNDHKADLSSFDVTLGADTISANSSEIMKENCEGPGDEEMKEEQMEYQEEEEDYEDDGLENWLPRVAPVYVLNDSVRTTKNRVQIVQDWYKTGGVLLMGYEMYRLLNSKKIGPRPKKPKGSDPVLIDLIEDEKTTEYTRALKEALVQPGPDLIICDEGHRIKNSHAGISQSLKNIATKRRVVLTGYPLQNNLLEYWCMVDFVRPNYLGTRQEFANMFERPIMNGQCKDSTPEDVKLMRYRAHVLHSLVKGFVQRRSHDVLYSALPNKVEFVILVTMSQVQRVLYKAFMDTIGKAGMTSWANNNALKTFAVCYKIWNHPDILYNAFKQHRLDLSDLDIDLNDESTAAPNSGDKPVSGKSKRVGSLASLKSSKSSASCTSFSTVASTSGLSGLSDIKRCASVMSGASFGTEDGCSFEDKKEQLLITYDWAEEILRNYKTGRLENGGKMLILKSMIHEALALGDKVLVFSQSLFTLNLIEEYLSKDNVPGRNFKWARGQSYFRLDGSTPGNERERLINRFNALDNSDVHLFLLSTRAGCLGINLIGANRVIIFDASWNPCHDCQAVCRVYRYGQCKPCAVYRLVTDNTMEKKIFDRQINKQGMSARVVDEMNPQNNMTRNQVEVLLEFEDRDLPSIDKDLSEFCEDPVLKKIIEDHYSWITKKPFSHESLLIDHAEERLTRHEKKLAKQSYEMEKKMSTGNFPRPSYSAFYPRTAGPYRGFNPRVGHRPVASVRPMLARPMMPTPIPLRPPSTSASSTWHIKPTSTRPPVTVGSARPTFLKPGVSVQQMKLKSDIPIPGNQSGAGPTRIPAGENVLVIRTPKGVYIRTPHGKIFAVRSIPKGMEEGEGSDSASEVGTLDLPLTAITAVTSDVAMDSSSAPLDSQARGTTTTVVSSDRMSITSTVVPGQSKPTITIQLKTTTSATAATRQSPIVFTLPSSSAAATSVRRATTTLSASVFDDSSSSSSSSGGSSSSEDLSQDSGPVQLQAVKPQLQIDNAKKPTKGKQPARGPARANAPSVPSVPSVPNVFADSEDRVAPTYLDPPANPNKVHMPQVPTVPSQLHSSSFLGPDSTGSNVSGFNQHSAPPPPLYNMYGPASASPLYPTPHYGGVDPSYYHHPSYDYWRSMMSSSNPRSMGQLTRHESYPSYPPAGSHHPWAYPPMYPLLPPPQYFLPPQHVANLGPTAPPAFPSNLAASAAMPLDFGLSGADPSHQVKTDLAAASKELEDLLASGTFDL